MKYYRNLLAILAATIWISLSEFLRNQFLLNKFWVDHYDSLGMTFPAEAINGAVWGIWSLLYAVTIFIIARKFTLWQTTLIAWLTGFLMMWLVIGNLGVLPFGMLIYAVPLSLLEAFLAAFIIRSLSASGK
jgi:hypothetical protein